MTATNTCYNFVGFRYCPPGRGGGGGGEYTIFPRNFQFFFVAVITFFSLSSVQIIFIPACCLLCVLLR